MPRDKWSAKSKKDSEKKVKITEKQLRNMVKQTLNESSDRGYNMTYNKAPVPVRSRASAEFTAVIKGKNLTESRINAEATLMSDLDSIASAIEEIAAGMYGLQDPGDPSVSAGDEMAGDLEMQIQRLNDLHAAMVRHFESMDDAKEFDPNAPGMR